MFACIELAKRFVWFLPYNGSSSTQLSLTSFETILLHCIVIAVISACIKKNLSKLVNCYVAILILKMAENMQHFWHIMLYYLKKGKKATQMQKDLCSVCAVTDENVSNVVCKASCWRFLAGCCSVVR